MTPEENWQQQYGGLFIVVVVALVVIGIIWLNNINSDSMGMGPGQTGDCLYEDGWDRCNR